MKIMVSISLVSYLQRYMKEWGKAYVSKTLGGQIWVSDEPADYIGKDASEKNYIEFDLMGERLPKEMWKYIDIEPCTSVNLKGVINQLKEKEKQEEER